MNLINEQAEHKVFGMGKIIEQELDRMVIQFSEKYGTKRFIYPDAFGTYLKLNDARLETGMQEELKKLHILKAQIEEEKARKRQEFGDVFDNKKLEKLKLTELKKKSTKKVLERKPEIESESEIDSEIESEIESYL